MSAPEEPRVHRVEPRIDRHGYIDWAVTCSGDSTAACHQDCNDGDRCESWWGMERGPDGTWTHEATVFDDDDQERTVRHAMLGSDECNVINLLDAEPSLIGELYDGPGAPLRADFITTTWDDAGGYNWRYHDDKATS